MEESNIEKNIYHWTDGLHKTCKINIAHNKHTTVYGIFQSEGTTTMDMNEISLFVLYYVNYTRVFGRLLSIIIQGENNICACIFTAYYSSISQILGEAYSQQLERYALLDMQFFPRDQFWTDLGTAIS